MLYNPDSFSCLIFDRVLYPYYLAQATPENRLNLHNNVLRYFLSNCLSKERTRRQIGTHIRIVGVSTSASSFEGFSVSALMSVSLPRISP